ncbi:hypothetical protein PILCRDRAFT_825475 [Piloderma croceum F 1598]|uniref:Uncharacterized protein n=1 Tax=Piloderma croceum (strain F 1598) TaxID=765440 RepID=A0A0C3BIX5_PILCF|nr:hypothetical protein PILCRDRAFT_825475 [Piloderma croceum F 1598]
MSESRTSISLRPVSINLQAVFYGRITSERDPREQARIFRAFWSIWFVGDANEKGAGDRQIILSTNGLKRGFRMIYQTPAIQPATNRNYSLLSNRPTPAR